MITSKEVKELFHELSISQQNTLLNDLLLEHELQGKILKEANKEVVQKRNKKPGKR